MPKVPRRFKLHFPIFPFLLLLVTLILCYLNYQPGTTLSGWDNLQSELNLNLNLKRAIYAVWQEYQSLGLLGGMAHAADLPRIIFLIVLQSFGVANSFLRYSWTFLSLIIGPVGTYFLIENILNHRFDKTSSKIASFLGGLFYLLNLATVQYFFTPFETFHTFYAFLPLLILIIIKYLHKPSTPLYFSLFTLSFLSAPSFYVQTLFVVFILTLIPFSIEHLISHKHKIKSLFSLATCYLLLATSHLYWLLPVIFFALNNASVSLKSKTNLIATPETFLRNLEFSNLKDIALLKGFWFNYIDLSGTGKFDYLMLAWRNHLNEPTILAIGYALFFLVIVGIYYGIKKKIPQTFSFLLLFLLCYFFLLGGSQVLGDKFPIISELLRSPFTKFSVVLSLSYSFFFSIGCIFLLDLFQTLHHRFTYYLTTFTIATALIIFTTPIFTGNLFSASMRLKIPSEYFQLIEFFKTQDKSTRIANLPQHTFWGWNFYNWGYRGSGFLWYGIEQPILDRAFDVWNLNNEKYYEELSTAIYSQDQKKFEDVLDKYAINYLVVDRNIISPGKDSILYTNETFDLLDNSPKLKLLKNFNDTIFVYQTDIDKSIKNFLSLSPVIPPLRDRSRINFGMTLRPIPLDPTSQSLTFNFKLSPLDLNLFIPSITQSENYLPYSLSYRKMNGSLRVILTPITPDIKIGNQKINFPKESSIVDFPLTSTQNGFVLEVNKHFYELQIPDEVASQSIPYIISTFHLPTKKAVEINLYSATPSYYQNLTNSFLAADPKQCFIEKPNSKVEKIVNGKTLSLIGTDVVGCQSVPIDQPTDFNQLISLSFKYMSSTNTPANASVTDENYNSSDQSVPLPVRNISTFVQNYFHPTNQRLQVNLILEANETRTPQEITYSDIKFGFHDLLGSSSIFLPAIPSQSMTINDSEANDAKQMTVSFPIITSPLTIRADTQSNNLNPDPKNCDNFNRGTFNKTFRKDQTGTKNIDSAGFLYNSINANSCDQMDLRNLPHDTAYALLFDQEFIAGLPLTTCLENHTTRRCDVYERLDKTSKKQFIIQPIVNKNESPGYTLHIFNQSIGQIPTQNLVRSIIVTPLPLNFLQGITVNNSPLPPRCHSREGGNLYREILDPCLRRDDYGQIVPEQGALLSSSHDFPFLYKLQTKSDSDQTLNLYQSYDSNWKTISVSEKDFNLPTWKLIFKLPYLYFNSSVIPAPSVIPAKAGIQWHNAYLLPQGNQSIILFYLPQYLEFIGLIILPLSLFVIVMLNLFQHRSIPK